jgi:hypothetical protein
VRDHVVLDVLSLILSLSYLRNGYDV